MIIFHFDDQQHQTLWPVLDSSDGQLIAWPGKLNIGSSTNFDICRWWSLIGFIFQEFIKHWVEDDKEYLNSKEDERIWLWLAARLKTNLCHYLALAYTKQSIQLHRLLPFNRQTLFCVWTVINAKLMTVWKVEKRQMNVRSASSLSLCRFDMEKM